MREDGEHRRQIQIIVDDSRAVGADGVEACVAHRDLAAVAEQDINAGDNNDIEHRVAAKQDQVALMECTHYERI